MLGWLLALVTAGAPPAATADEHARMAAWLAAPGPWHIEVMNDEWTDPRRPRTLPVKLFWPSRDGGPFPVVLLSGGLGSTRDGYDYLGQHWAGHGYLTIVLQHPGSDLAIFDAHPDPLEAMRRVADDPDYLLHRPLDLKFAVDELARRHEAPGRLRGKVDWSRVAVAGHSFGAYAAMALAGMTIITPTDELRLGDARVRAAIVLSPPVPTSPAEPEREYGTIGVPAFYATSVADESPLGETRVARRRVPFDVGRADRYLLTFRRGDHFIFAGWRGKIGDGSFDERAHDVLEMATCAFLDGYLRGDATALAWLADGGLATTARREARVEVARPGR